VGNKTLRKILGAGFLFESSVGHVRDLPQKGFGIDVDADFEPQYEVLPDKEKVVQKLIAAAKKADVVYLSPDPDREGEAIAWHISQLLPKGTQIKRAAFNSITKAEVERALQETSDINFSLVDAQQARRLLDRIVGYKVSPILARKVARGRRVDGGLSAGRVQSVALMLVVDREKEIDAFIPMEYWTITALLKDGGKEFKATLHTIDGEKVEKETVPNEKTAKGLQKRVKEGNYKVGKVEKKEKKRNPAAPFITSTLQQEASRHHGFNAHRTMGIAQSLYEGIDMSSEGTEGLITYMRTDSVQVAPEAIHAVRDLIGQKFGAEYLPKNPRMYKSKKSAQEAHEAIRPTNLSHPPEKVKIYLTKEQFLLYSLIWKRFVASQMNSAIYDTASVDAVGDNGLVLRATGSIMKFPGYLALYHEKSDDELEAGDKILPPLTEGDPLHLKKAEAEQSFTKPPSRFTEASLVKELEKSGIGRPSTYASIMGKIQGRSYTVKEKGRLKPTDLGKVCAELLVTAFPKIMNVDFTAHMEDDLELVASGKKEWKKLLKEFWKDFLPTVEEAEKHAFVPKLPTDLPCPKCGKMLQKIWARTKYFYGCTGYPDCDYAAPIEEASFDKSEYDEDFDWEQKCPECGLEMKTRHGRFGAFLGCTKYPDCKGTVNIPKKGEEFPTESVSCPAIDCSGRISARRGRFGKVFFSCSTYPDCDVIVNNLDQLQDKYQNHPRTAYVKKKRSGKKGGGPTKKLSPELQAVCDAKELTRGEVTKKLWIYIKANNLQDPNDKRNIVPDEKLTKIFGTTEPVNMFQLAGLLSKHLS